LTKTTKIIGAQFWNAAIAHLRHDPPMTTRTWVLTDEGRASRIGFQLECKRCDEEPDALNE